MHIVSIGAPGITIITIVCEIDWRLQIRQGDETRRDETRRERMKK